MSGRRPQLDPEERKAFCREVMESLSELIEGEAPDELCRRVEEELSDCEAFLIFRSTFAATVKLAAEHGRQPPADLDEQAFQRCVAAARARLRR